MLRFCDTSMVSVTKTTRTIILEMVVEKCDPRGALVRLWGSTMRVLWRPLIECSIAQPHDVLYGSYRGQGTLIQSLRAWKYT